MMKNKFKRLRAFGTKISKAQHLVELVLFFPFLVGIIGLLTEIAYGLNTGIELNSALNRAVGIVSSIQRNNTNASNDTIKNEIYTNTHSILVSRKVPYADTLKIDTLEADDFIVIIGTYTYTYAFKLVNLFFSAVPEHFYFKSIVLTNKSLYAPNNYNISDKTLSDTFENYSQQGESGIEAFLKAMLDEYQKKWEENHKKMWQDYVEKIKKAEEEKKKAEEEAKKQAEQEAQKAQDEQNNLQGEEQNDGA